MNPRIKFSSVELSMCLLNISLHYGNRNCSVVFFGILDGRKCLQTESINLIKIHCVIRCIVIRCIRKTLKNDYYLYHVCPLGLTQLTLGVFHEIFGDETTEKL